MKIVAITGSLQVRSSNAALVRAALTAAPAGMVIDAYESLGELPYVNPEIDGDGGDAPAAVADLRARLQAADGALIASPEYGHSMPGVLKNALDAASRPYGQSAWDKKPAAIVSASPGGIGGFGANHQVRQSCVFLNMPVMQQPEAYWGLISDDKIAADGTVHDEMIGKLVHSFANAFADWVDLIAAGRASLAPDPTQQG